MAVELFLSAAAGAAAAAAATRALRPRARVPQMGASARVRAEVSSLESRRRILERSIARLNEGVAGLTEAQRDALLARYQRELGEVGARLGTLEEAARHPDLGALGDGLVTIMDQRLSELDAKFGELSARITATQAARAAGPRRGAAAGRAEEGAGRAEAAAQPRPAAQAREAPRSMELTTLTVVPAGAAPQPFAPLAPQGTAPPAQPRPASPPPAQPQVTPQEPAPAGPAPEPQVSPEPAPSPEPVPPVPGPVIPPPERDDELDVAGDDSDEEDLAKIKRDILKTLNRLDQAEVE